MLMHRYYEGCPVNHVEPILEEKVLLRLIEDIGLENTRKFMDTLDGEYQKRIGLISQALSEHSYEKLSAQAHSLKSSAQVSGAYRLADLLNKIEITANLKNAEAFELGREALTLAELTRFAYLDVNLPG